jgi:hypothetical protein
MVEIGWPVIPPGLNVLEIVFKGLGGKLIGLGVEVVAPLLENVELWFHELLELGLGAVF